MDAEVTKVIDLTSNLNLSEPKGENNVPKSFTEKPDMTRVPTGKEPVRKEIDSSYLQEHPTDERKEPLKPEDKKVEDEKKVIEAEKQKQKESTSATLDRGWKALMDKESEFVRRDKELRERARMIEADMKDFNEWKSLKELKSKNPLEYYKRVADYDDYTSKLIGAKKDPKEEGFDELRNEVKMTREEIQNWQKEKSKREYEELDSKNTKMISDYLGTNKEKYPTILKLKRYGVVKDYAIQNIDNFGEASDEEILAKSSEIVENALWEELESFAKLYDELKLLKTKPSQTNTPPSSEQAKNEASKKPVEEKITLSNEIASQPAASHSEEGVLSRDEYIRRAAKHRFFVAD